MLLEGALWAEKQISILGAHSPWETGSPPPFLTRTPGVGDAGRSLCHPRTLQLVPAVGNQVLPRRMHREALTAVTMGTSLYTASIPTSLAT